MIVFETFIGARRSAERKSYLKYNYAAVYTLESPFRVFRVFRGSLTTSLEFIIQPRNSRKARELICRSRKPSLFLLSQALKT